MGYQDITDVEIARRVAEWRAMMPLKNWPKGKNSDGLSGSKHEKRTRVKKINRDALREWVYALDLTDDERAFAKAWKNGPLLEEWMIEPFLVAEIEMRWENVLSAPGRQAMRAKTLARMASSRSWWESFTGLKAFELDGGGFGAAQSAKRTLMGADALWALSLGAAASGGPFSALLWGVAAAEMIGGRWLDGKGRDMGPKKRFAFALAKSAAPWLDWRRDRRGLFLDRMRLDGQDSWALLAQKAREAGVMGPELSAEEWKQARMCADGHNLFPMNEWPLGQALRSSLEAAQIESGMGDSRGAGASKQRI